MQSINILPCQRGMDMMEARRLGEDFVAKDSWHRLVDTSLCQSGVPPLVLKCRYRDAEAYEVAYLSSLSLPG